MPYILEQADSKAHQVVSDYEGSKFEFPIFFYYGLLDFENGQPYVCWA